MSQIWKKIKVACRSEMARNAIESVFWTSKMGAGGHFVKKNKKSFVLIWNGQKCDQQWISDIQNGRRRPICKKSLQIFSYWSEMARNAIKSEFRTSNMAAGSHIVKQIIMVLIWNGKKWFLDIQNGYRWPFKKKITKKVERVIWTMFEPTAGRIQLDINSLLVNIYTDRYVGNEGIYIVFAL